jgi:hypothetical protein
LERRVESTLIATSLFDIGSFGWLNAEDPDPSLIGHAMWQSREGDLDFNAIMGEAPVRRRPDEIDRDIHVAGEDFCGLMQASRWSIGLALVWKGRDDGNPYNENPFFWVHHTDAFLKLSIASNRLRELLILACFGEPVTSYHEACKRKHQRPNPYSDAAPLLASRGLDDGRVDEALAALPSLGNQLSAFVRRRNAIVHEVATRIASFTKADLSELQKRYDQEQTEGFSPRPAFSPAPNNWLAAAQAREAELHAEVDRAAGELREWYLLLVQASNCVFQVEYWTRVLGRR